MHRNEAVERTTWATCLAHLRLFRATSAAWARTSSASRSQSRQGRKKTRAGQRGDGEGAHRSKVSGGLGDDRRGRRHEVYCVWGKSSISHVACHGRNRSPAVSLVQSSRIQEALRSERAVDAARSDAHPDIYARDACGQVHSSSARGVSLRHSWSGTEPKGAIGPLQSACLYTAKTRVVRLSRRSCDGRSLVISKVKE